MKVLKLATDRGPMAVRADVITYVERTKDWQGALVHIDGCERPVTIQNATYEDFVQLWTDTLADPVYVTLPD